MTRCSTPAVTRPVIERFAACPQPDPARPTVLATLSQREHEVLRLLVAGCSNREIGERLFVSEATVKTHVMAVLRKLEPARPDPGGLASVVPRTCRGSPRLVTPSRRPLSPDATVRS